MVTCQGFLIILSLLSVSELQSESATQKLYEARSPHEKYRHPSYFPGEERGNFTQLRQSECLINEFRCSDGSCISEIYRCDGIADCPDKSDERNCDTACPPRSYRCYDGSCVPKKYRCDKVDDCADKSDEQNCRVICGSRQMRCNDGSCVALRFKCDNIADCPDKSDEADCGNEGGSGGGSGGGSDGGHEVICGSMQMRCNDGTCIPKRFKCDNIEDCPDKSDEADCGGGSGAGSGGGHQVQCGATQIRCKDGTCIPERFKCDKIVDCPDKSDETDCGSESLGQCTENEFKCGDYHCIPSTYTCDSVDDCTDASDEANCGGGESSGTVTSYGCSNCGVKFPPENRIKFGEETGMNEWPWQVYLEIEKDRPSTCGGVLYKDKYVLTAARCLGPRTKNVDVFIGEHQLWGGNETRNLKIKASRMTSHPLYQHAVGGTESDIAVVELLERVKFGDRVRPICMSEVSADFTGKTAWVTGWGTIKAGSTSNLLRETPISVWPQPQCRRHGATSNTVCGLGNTSRKNTDSCTGDEGGPLVYKDSHGRWSLIGIASKAPSPCTDPVEPGIYTMVNKYLSWIRQETRDGRC